MKTFKKLLEEMGVAVVNVGSGHIAGTKEAGDDPPVYPKKKRNPIIGFIRRKPPKR